MFEKQETAGNLNLQLIDFKLDEIKNMLSKETVHLKSNEALYLRVFIEQILKELPKIARDSLTQQRYLDKKRSMFKFDSNVEEIKNYLRMLENFGYAKTLHIREKIDDLNKIVKFYAS